jgi:hypothetical protein
MEIHKYFKQVMTIVSAIIVVANTLAVHPLSMEPVLT